MASSRISRALLLPPEKYSSISARPASMPCWRLTPRSMRMKASEESGKR
ncbi:Uncharacterised protein [Bordetella pertussis]|nr:Uncharacterised protein [Bordetella pertussis]